MVCILTHAPTVRTYVCMYVLYVRTCMHTYVLTVCRYVCIHTYILCIGCVSKSYK